MSKKLSIEEIESVIKNSPDIEAASQKMLIEKLNKMLQSAASEKGPKKPKGEFAVILKSPGVIPDNTVAAVFAVPNGFDPATLLDSVRAAAVDYNCSSTKKKTMFKGLTDILFSLRPKWLKARGEGLKIMTKEWCDVKVITPEQDSNFIS